LYETHTNDLVLAWFHLKDNKATLTGTKG
jgi:hypothetical protein